MKRPHHLLLASLALCFILAACGSASAPPVDLPAPITGRATEPGVDGTVKVTGDPGSVSAGALVMAENSNVTEATAMRVLDMLVSTANAADAFPFPAICSEAGYACAWADASGGYEITIAAEPGDVLYVYVINGAGQRISEKLRVQVPSLTTCAGKSLAGAAVDVLVVPGDGTPILLKQGSDTTPNQLVIGASNPTTVDIAGCYAHSLAIYKGSVTTRIVATSKEDSTIWRGTYASGEITSSETFKLSDTVQPMHAAFTGSSSQAIVALGSGTSMTMGLFSFEGDGAILAQSPAIAGATRSLRVATQQIDGWLGLVVADAGAGTDYVMGLFDAEELDAVTAFTKANTSLKKAEVAAILDAGFWINGDSNLQIAMVGNVGTTGRVMSVGIASALGVPLNSKTGIPADATALGTVTTSATQQLASRISRMVFSSLVSTGEQPPTLIAAGPSGEIFLTPITKLSDTGDIVAKTVSAGHNFIAISLDDKAKSLFVGDATTNTARSASAYFDWASPP